MSDKMLKQPESEIDTLYQELESTNQQIESLNLERIGAIEVLVSSSYTMKESYSLLLDRYARVLRKFKEITRQLDLNSLELSKVLSKNTEMAATIEKLNNVIMNKTLRIEELKQNAGKESDEVS